MTVLHERRHFVGPVAAQPGIHLVAAQMRR